MFYIDSREKVILIVRYHVIFNFKCQYKLLIISRVNQPISLYNVIVLIDRVVPVTILTASSCILSRRSLIRTIIPNNWRVLKNRTQERNINLIQSITFNCKLQFSQDTKIVLRTTNSVNMRISFVIATQCDSKMFMIESCW